MFLSKVRTSVPLKGRLLALPTDIRLGWRDHVREKHFSFLRLFVSFEEH
jgi:hypothetical protein